MTEQTVKTWMRCDHCGGLIRIHLESNDRGDRVTYSCDGCGCRWGWGFVLEHKGARCPVHGDAAADDPGAEGGQSDD